MNTFHFILNVILYILVLAFDRPVPHTQTNFKNILLEFKIMLVLCQDHFVDIMPALLILLFKLSLHIIRTKLIRNETG